MNADLEAAIETGWEEVIARWEDEAAHQRFLALCMSLSRLDAAGTRYRKAKEEDPSRAEIADSQINRILGLAMQNMASTEQSTQPAINTRVIRWVLYGIAFCMLLGSAWLLFQLRL